VEALARAVTDAKPGAMVRFDDAGRSFRAVPGSGPVKPRFGDYSQAFESGRHLLDGLVHAETGRPLSQVRHCWLTIPESQARPLNREEALDAVLKALDEAAAAGK
jgi:hypothetical protein